MAILHKVGVMDKPTGPSGILASNRPKTKAGGKRRMGSTKGLVSSPGKTMIAARKMGRGR